MEIILKLFKLPVLVENSRQTSIHVNEVRVYVHVFCVHAYIHTCTWTAANTHVCIHTNFEEKTIHLLQAYCILEVRNI